MRCVHFFQSYYSTKLHLCINTEKCLITVEMGQATDIGQTIIKSGIDLDAPKHIFVMIFAMGSES